jgi:hypothetical protein
MKIILTTILLVSASCLKADLIGDTIPHLERIESNGNANAVGDNGLAWGILQIRKEVIEDVNRFSKIKFTHQDAYSPEHARAICRIYLQHYCTPIRLGHEPTMEDLARVWNGGPNGFKKRQTLAYAIKLSQLIK